MSQPKDSDARALEKTNFLIAELRGRPSWSAIISLRDHLTVQGGWLPRAQIDRALDSIEISSAHLLVPDRSQGNLHFSLEILSLPPLFTAFARRPKDQAFWKTLQTALNPPALSRSGQLGATELLIWLLAEAMLSNPSAGFATMVRHLAVVDAERLRRHWPKELSGVGHALRNYGWFERLDPEIETALTAGLAAHLKMPATLFPMVATLLDLAGFSRDAPEPWLKTVFEAVLVPAMEVAAGDPDKAAFILDAEAMIYNEYLKKNESNDQVRNIYKRIGPILEKAGARTRSHAGSFPARPDKTEGGAVHRVGFVFLSDGFLAHAQNFLVFLRGLKSLRDGRVQPLVYILVPGKDNRDTRFVDALAQFDVPLRRPNQNLLATGTDPALWLREHSVQDGLSVVVFVSNPIAMIYSATLGVAPVHIWWSMKWHQIASAAVDGYITTGSIFENERVIEGRRWRSCRGALSNLFDPAVAAEAAKIRAAHGTAKGTVILGCLAREERFLNPAYVDALRTILQRCSNAVYLWTGTTQPPEFLAMLKQAGIAERCYYVGWVNTKVYAQVLDVYVDSFPFASGHTAYEAMAAGCPLVVLLTHEARQSSTATGILPAYDGTAGTAEEQQDVRAIFTAVDGSNLLPFVSDAAHYVDLATRLVEDRDVRGRFGRAGKAFVDKYLRDEKRFSESTCNHILEVITQKQAALSD